MRVGIASGSVFLVRAGRIEGRGGPEAEAVGEGVSGSEARRGDRERRVGALREPDRGDPRPVDIGKRRNERQSAVSVRDAFGEIDGAGLLEAAGRKIVDEQRHIAGSRERGFDRAAVRRQAEAGVQEHDGRERPGALRLRQIALDVRAVRDAGLTARRGALEFRQLLGRRRRGPLGSDQRREREAQDSETAQGG